MKMIRIKNTKHGMLPVNTQGRTTYLRRGQEMDILAEDAAQMLKNKTVDLVEEEKPEPKQEVIPAKPVKNQAAEAAPDVTEDVAEFDLSSLEGDPDDDEILIIDADNPDPEVVEEEKPEPKPKSTRRKTTQKKSE